MKTQIELNDLWESKTSYVKHESGALSVPKGNCFLNWGLWSIQAGPWLHFHGGSPKDLRRASKIAAGRQLQHKQEHQGLIEN